MLDYLFGVSNALQHFLDDQLLQILDWLKSSADEGFQPRGELLVKHIQLKVLILIFQILIANETIENLSLIASKD